MRWKGHLLASGAVLAALVGVSAHAQTRGGAAAGTTIEELVVTAEKREQSLQDVPVAVSAFTSEKRDLIGINTVTDLTNFTPGLEYNAQNDRNTLRGVGRNTNVHAAEGSVAQYSDGIYTSSTTEAGKTPLFVDRLEVLRGPQGTLYGRNAIGGAINIISKRPTEDWYGEVRAQYQNYDFSVLEGAASGPTLIPGVNFRFGANWTKQRGGWFKNTLPGGKDEGNIIDTKYVEGQLQFKFNERFDGWMKLAWQDWHNDGGGPGSRSFYTPAPWPVYEAATAALAPTSGYGCLGVLFPNLQNAVTNVVAAGGAPLSVACNNAAQNDAHKFTSAVPYQVKLTGTMIFASEFTYHFDNMDLKYIGGGTHYHYHLTGPTPVEQAPIFSFQLPRVLPPALVGLPATSPAVVVPGGGPIVRPRYAFSYEEQENWYSHEVNLASSGNGPFQWIAGAYYYDEVYNQPVSTALMDMPTNFGVQVANLCGPPLNPNPAATGVCPALPGNNRVYDDRPHLEIMSKAVFGQVDWQFAEHWKTTVGLRYTRDDKAGYESLRILCVDVTACAASPELVGSNFWVDLTQLPTVVGGYPGFPGSAANTPGVSESTAVDPATGFATRHYKSDWDAVTGTAGIQWDPAPGTMAYARYSRGYKAGGFRIGIDTTIGVSPTTNPEHAHAFEIGLKKDWGRTLQTNMALFYYKYTDAQIPITVAATAGGVGQAQSIFYNIPEAVSQGFELESIWQPVDHLQILFNYSYLDAHITQSSGVVDPADPAALAPGAKPIITFAQCVAAVGTPQACTPDVFTGPGSVFIQPNGTVVSNNVGGFQRGQDLRGSNLPNAPKNKVSINVNYTWEFSPGSLIGSVNYIWRDKQFGSIFNRTFWESPSYDQWDARLTWKDRDNKFTVIAFVKNIFDDLGYEGGASAVTGRRAGFLPGYILGLTGAAGAAAVPVVQGPVASTYPLTPPRTYGIELQYRF